MATQVTNDPGHDFGHDTAQPGQELLAQLLRAGHRVRVTVRGISMLPTISNGDQVLLEPLQNGTAQRGDIVFVPATTLAEVGQFVQSVRSAMPVDFNLSYQFGANGGNGTTVITP